MGLRENFNRMHKIYKEDREESIKEYRKNIAIAKNDRVKKLITKRFQTSFIGSISSIENNLGKLWGHGKNFNELTDSEKKFRNLWQKLRNEILDKSNHQLRLLLTDLGEDHETTN